MGRRITIKASDYREILQWEDDGGSAVDLIYEVIPDEPDGDDRRPITKLGASFSPPVIHGALHAGLDRR